MSHVTHVQLHEDMGWLRLVGSLKSYVSFAENSLFYGALLQKRPMILESLLSVGASYWLSHLGESPVPYECVCVCDILTHVNESCHTCVYLRENTGLRI